MSAEAKSSSGSGLIRAIIGVALMVGGYWFSQNVHLEFIKMLEHQGIPLDPGKTISIIGVFLILFPAIDAFFIKPLGEAIHNRTTELERTFEEVEDLRSDMAKMKSDYEQRLAATEASAREQIQEQISAAQELRRSLEADAKAKADDWLRRAQEDIDTEKNRIIGDLRLKVVDLTLLATEKVLGKNVDSDANRQLVKDFIDTVEVPA